MTTLKRLRRDLDEFKRIYKRMKIGTIMEVTDLFDFENPNNPGQPFERPKRLQGMIHAIPIYDGPAIRKYST